METYEFVDIGTHEEGQCSKLYNLSPIGIGTSLIESLTSYISRLADAHGVDTGTLIGKEITPILNKHYLNKVAQRGGSGLYGSATGLNGLASGAKDIFECLQCLTLRNDLIYTTMLTWSEVIPTRGLMRSSKAWCPVCLEEWKENNKPIYEPLLWFLQEVIVCPIHYIRLQTYCPSCLEEIPFLSRKMRNGHCSHCGFWLGQKIQAFTKLDVEKHYWDFWRTKYIGEIIETVHVSKQHPKKEKIKSVLKKAVNECSKGVQSQFATMVDVRESTLRSWTEGNSLPSIANLLRLSFCLGITLNQFITEPISNIKFCFRKFPFEDNANHIEHRRFPDGYIEEQLKKWANENLFPPPSIKEIASIIGCSRKLLYKKASELCRTISERRHEYINNRAQARIVSSIESTIKAVQTLSGKGLYPSRRKVEDFLQMPGLIKEEIIRNVWEKELVKLRIK